MSDDLQRGNPLETAPIPTLLLRYSVPTALTLMVNFLYNIVDQIFIGRGVGISGMTRRTSPSRSLSSSEPSRSCSATAAPPMSVSHSGGGSRRRRTPPSAKP